MAGRSTILECSIAQKSTSSESCRRLAPEIDAGLPIVFLEPSCASVFRDELCALFPKDSRAARLRDQSFLFGEFLQSHGAAYQPPKLDRKVLLHRHCHDKALMTLKGGEALLRGMGVELQLARFGLLRDGRRLWVRAREIRNFACHRRKGSVAGGARKPSRIHSSFQTDSVAGSRSPS